MIILMKQLFDEALTLEKIELEKTDFLQSQQILELKPDILVATTAQDNALVLTLALKNKVSFALYQPDIQEIEALLLQSLAPDYAGCGKILYLKPEDYLLLIHSGHPLASLQTKAVLMLEGDYMQQCEQLAFDSIYWGVEII